MSQKHKILAVDDTPSNLKMLIDALRCPDYEVLVTTSGEKALSLAESHKPALILLDVMMPEMDGYEVCRRLKQNPDLCAIPVIFITAMTDEEDETKGLELGAVDYISKPIRPAIVQARVRTHLRLKLAQEKSDQLLLNVFPVKVAEDLKQTGQTLPELFKNVTIYFSDMVGFTKLSASLTPDVLIAELNDIFTQFDNIIEKYGCERVKTIGDAYLSVCGMPEANPNHAENMLRAAIEIVQYLEQRNHENEHQWQIRIGIHSGDVVGGVVGVKKYIYDVFGDAINTAARMEANSEPMRINVSEQTYELLKNKFTFIPRALQLVKGKGEMKMFFVGYPLKT